MRFWGTPAGHRTEGKVKLSTKEVGEWHVAKGALTVSYGPHEKSAPLGAFALNPQALARVLLAELVMDELEARGAEVKANACSENSRARELS
jgi:hypothetical protein